MMKVRTHVSALTASLLCASMLGGCSGGGSTVPQAPAGTKANAKAAFTIHWPQHTAAAVTRRSPHYLSQSAQAVIVEVNPNAATPGKVNFSGPLTIINNNGTPTTTVAIDAPVGSDEFIFTVWDAQQSATETTPAGNLLGQSDVTQTIVAGKTNNVGAVIGGITSSIDIKPLANQPFLETDATIGYDLVGDTPETFTATPKDVDGNIIVGPGAPTLSFAPSTTSGAYLNVAPVSGQPNEFTVASIAAAPIPQESSLAPLGVVVTATADGAPQSLQSNLSLSQRSAVYVSYGTGSGGSMVLAYDDQGNNIPLPSTAFTGLFAPSGVAYDSKTHQVFVADTAANTVKAFDAYGNSIATFNGPTVAGARGVAYDPQSDNLYATGTTIVVPFKADGSTPSGMAAGAFTQVAGLQPDGIAAVGVNLYGQPDDEIAVANDAAAAKAQSVSFFYSNGGFIRTLNVTNKIGVAGPFPGLAFNAGVSGPSFQVTGGPAGASFRSSTTVGGTMTDTISYTPPLCPTGTCLTTTSTNHYGGVAISSTVYHNSTGGTTGGMQYEEFVVVTDLNLVQGYTLSSLAFGGSGPPHLTNADLQIQTPAGSGLTNPIGIAIVQ